MAMDIQKIKAFVVVAEELNFRRSAELLHMSQPPLTRLIAALEEEVGAKLFNRTTRSVQLTGAGVVMLKEARDILAAMERIKKDVRAAGKSSSATLRIGFSATAFLARFPTIIEEFKTRYPKVRLDLEQAPANEVLRDVARGELDAGFVETHTAFQGLGSHCVSEEKLGVLLPRSHPLAKRKEISFSELAGETIILHHKREAEEFYNRISRLIQGLERRPKIYIKADKESCPLLVATGRGVSLTIAGAEKAFAAGTRFVPLKGMFLPVSVFWDQTEPKEALKTFICAVIENKALKHAQAQCLSLTADGV